MKNGKFQNGKKGTNMKPLAILLAVTLLVGCAVGGTIAWLTANTGTITNTFTVGNIDIKLNETPRDFKMVPGNDISKDPVVTVEKGSEACWLFVKVEESPNLDDFIAYTMADGWTELTADPGIYWRQVEATGAADKTFEVLAGNKVTVLEGVTKDMMDAIAEGEANEPTLSFTAYAVQQANIPDAATAWTKVAG